MQRPHHALRLRRRARGVGLLDALIALAILAFGLLGMSRLQTHVVRQSSESQARMTAVQLADELLSTALADTSHAACYTLPAEGDCPSEVASDRTTEWETRLKASLPGEVQATSVLTGDQLTVTIRWTGDASGDDRKVEVTTDVRS